MHFESALLGLGLFRLLLAYAGQSEELEYHHLLSSPLTSFVHLKEGVHLLSVGVDPYSGGVFRHSPLALSLFSTVLPLSQTLAPLLFTLSDILAAYLLVGIWRVRSRRNDTVRDILVAIGYLFNPYLLFPSIACSTSTLENALSLGAVYFAAKRQASRSMAILAFLSQNALYSALLLPALAMTLVQGPSQGLSTPKWVTNYRRALSHAAEFAIYFTLFTFLSWWSAGGWNWVAQTWGAHITLPDLTPNAGLWWYFFTEMFDYFRPFFLLVFSTHLLIFVAPICIKFQHDPLFAAFLLQGLIATLKPYPTLSDPGLFLSTASLFPEIYPYLSQAMLTALLHLHAALLLPLFHSLWLSQGTGNANFFYASTLVFGLANMFGVSDCLAAGLKLPYGPMKEGQEITQQ